MPETDAFRRLLEFLPEPVFVLDSAGRVEEANAAARALLGADPVGRPLADRLAGDAEATRVFLRRCAGSGRPLVGSLTLRTADGERRMPVQGAALGRPAPGTAAGVVLRCRPEAASEFSILARKVDDLNREIRQRRRAQAALEEALRHKDMLLDELHHRVKNHTQMLLGMLSLSGRQTDSPELKAFIADLRARLQAIGAAQQLMYQAGQLEAVPARGFLERLCAAISESWPDSAELAAEAEDVVLRNDVTASLALIVNELAANALKHGLRFGPGRVVVALRRDGGELLLTVADSGAGWRTPPEDHRSSGLTLVRGLCRQIGGSFDIGSDAGTCCALRFPHRSVGPVAP